MIATEQGKVIEIVETGEEITEVVVQYQDKTTNPAIGYKRMISEIKEGDLVLCNKTAVLLSLGTGGYDFIISNLTKPGVANLSTGHIMKLRYTPLQIATESIEEQGSEFHEIFNEKKSLKGFPVIIGSLHSMVAPISIGIHSKGKNLKTVYIMSDGACLPIVFSKTVTKLKKLGLVSNTITYGHAFGGDYEAVNIYSALLAAKYCLGADLALVAMGPGIVGTGTVWGHTGLEQGAIANAVGVLKGNPIIVPRITFGDHRERHNGISHHTITVLEHICNTRANIVLPKLQAEKHKIVMDKLQEKSLLTKYNFVVRDGKQDLKIASDLGISLSIMGRGKEKESTYFETATAAGIYAGELGNKVLNAISVE